MIVMIDTMECPYCGATQSDSIARTDGIAPVERFLVTCEECGREFYAAYDVAYLFGTCATEKSEDE